MGDVGEKMEDHDLGLGGEGMEDQDWGIGEGLERTSLGDEGEG